MGEKLKKYYQWVESRGGIAARMRLAVKTGVSSSDAEVRPDSPELVEKFYQATKDIVGADAPRL